MEKNLINELIRVLNNDPQENPGLHDLFRISCQRQLDAPEIRVNAQPLPRPYDVESELRNILIATIRPVSVITQDKDGQISEALEREAWIIYIEPDFQSREKGQHPTISAATPNEAIEIAVQHAESAMQNHLYTQARKINRQIAEAEIASVLFNQETAIARRDNST